MRAENRRRAAPDSPFSPPYSSLAANLVQGGTQQNIMAGECRFSWEVRLLQGEDMRTILDPFERLFRQNGAEMREIGPKVSIATVETSSGPRSEEHRAGNEGGSTSRYRWSAYNEKKQHTQTLREICSKNKL